METMGTIGNILGLNRDNGKEHGNYGSPCCSRMNCPVILIMLVNCYYAFYL